MGVDEFVLRDRKRSYIFGIFIVVDDFICKVSPIFCHFIYHIIQGSREIPVLMFIIYTYPKIYR